MGISIYIYLNVLNYRFLFYNNKFMNKDKNVKLKCFKKLWVKVLKSMKNIIKKIK